MDLTPVARFGLLLVRPAMLVAIAPAFGGVYIPAPVKVGLTMLIALGLAPSVAVPPTSGDAALTLVILHEMAIGLSLAFVMRTVIVGVEFAGHLSSYQIGFSYGATIDPISGVRNTMLVSLYGSLATLTFLATNGHHALLRALVASYARLPIGAGEVNQSLPQAVRDILAMVFVIGLRLAAPVVIVLLIVELGIGLISRTAPSLSFMVIGYPIRIIVGLLVVAALISTIPAFTTSLLDSALVTATRTAAAFR